MSNATEIKDLSQDVFMRHKELLDDWRAENDDNFREQMVMRQHMRDEKACARSLRVTLAQIAILLGVLAILAILANKWQSLRDQFHSPPSYRPRRV